MICLIEGKGSTEFKGGNIDPEFLRICEIHHVVMSLHCADRRGQKAARAIGVRLAWANYRLLAYNAFSVKYLKFIQGIKDLPVTGCELYHILTLIFYGDGVTKCKVHFVVLEESTFESSVD